MKIMHPVLAGNAPGEFRKALERARAFLEEGSSGPRILTIDAWNEWTEGSHLEPDTVAGPGHLEAIHDVFGKKAEPAGGAAPSACRSAWRRTCSCTGTA